MGRVPWEMVAWGLGNFLFWLSLWPLTFTGVIPLWAAFLLSTLSITICYLPSHEAQHSIIGAKGSRYRWLNELVGHVSTILLTVTGNATRVKPACNAILSNVPGSREKLYLEGAELEALYPLSIVTDGMGLNITTVSYGSKLCIAAISCPNGQPGIENFGKLLRESYRDLKAAVDAA